MELQSARADIYIRNHVCARCYGDLSKQHSDEWDMYSVGCSSCGDAWGGAVIRRSTAERMGQRAVAEQMEVKNNLRDLFPQPNRKSVKKALQELGF